MGPPLSTFQSTFPAGWHREAYKTIEALINRDIHAANTTLKNGLEPKNTMDYLAAVIVALWLVEPSSQLFSEMKSRLHNEESAEYKKSRERGDYSASMWELIKPLIDKNSMTKGLWDELTKATDRGDCSKVISLLSDVNHKQNFEQWTKDNNEHSILLWIQSEEENLPYHRAAYKGYNTILKTLIDSLGPQTIKLFESPSFVNSMGECLAGRSESLPLLEVLFNAISQYNLSDHQIEAQKTIQKAYATWLFHCTLGICDSRVTTAILQKKSVDEDYIQVVSDLCKCAAILGVDTQTIIELLEKIPQADLIDMLTMNSECNASENYHYC